MRDETKGILIVLLNLAIKSLLGLSLLEIFEKVEKILDIIMPRLYATEYQSKDYQLFIATGILFGLVACISLVIAGKEREKKARKFMLGVVVFEYGFHAIIIGLMLLEIRMRIRGQMLYALDNDYWLLASFVFGLLGGHIALPLTWIICKLQELERFLKRQPCQQLVLYQKGL